MKALGHAVLGLLCAASVAFASSVRRPVALPSKACCETCTVARYVPPMVPPVPTSMVWSALFLEMSVLAAAAFGLAFAARRRPSAERSPRHAEPTPAES